MYLKKKNKYTLTKPPLRIYIKQTLIIRIINTIAHTDTNIQSLRLN